MVAEKSTSWVAVFFQTIFIVSLVAVAGLAFLCFKQAKEMKKLVETNKELQEGPLKKADNEFDDPGSKYLEK